VTERADALRDELEPAVTGLGLSLYDVVVEGGPVTTLRVVVDREGGVDLDGIEAATREVSRVLDASDPFRDAYTLEVTSPGLERTLRRPEHFAAAVGILVSVKTRDAEGRAERLRGTLAAADADAITVTTDHGERRVPLPEITQARTVFEWGPTPKPGRGSKPGSKPGRAKKEAHA
jgi:ribosome maturation factor RimP